MKNLKTVLLTTIGFFAIIAMVVFNACVKNPCTDLQCQHGASCSGGLCQCTAGWEGSECQIPASARFLGTYKGSLRCDDFPRMAKEMSISLVDSPNKIAIHLPFGNTSVRKIVGIAETPETHIVTHVDSMVSIHTYVTVDAQLIYVYLETYDKTIDYRQNCRFTGHRVKKD